MKFIEQTTKIPSIALDDKKVQVVSCVPEYTDSERDGVIDITTKIWKMLIDKTNNNDFKGVVRFDLVPRIKQNGVLIIDGIYEVNTGQPECSMLFAQVDKNIKNTKKAARPIEIVANKIKKEFSEKINIVLGSNKVKKEWGGNFIKVIENDNLLKINKVSEKEAMMTPDIFTWRLGDARAVGESHFSDKFVEWLQNNENKFFNTFCLNDNDPGNKELLIDSVDDTISSILGNNKKLVKENIFWAIKNKDNIVLKPSGGASGNGVVFGKNYSNGEWEKEMNRRIKIEEPNALWEKKMLSEIKIDNKKVVFDLNPVFWADGENLEYLYTMCRIMDIDEYKKSGIINVARGGGVLLPFK